MTMKRGITTVALGIALSLAAGASSFAQDNNTAEGSAVGYFTTNIAGAAAHPPAYAPGLITAPIASPTLFATQGLPSYVKGFPLLMSNFYTVAYHDVAIGESDGTRIIYNSSNVAKRPDLKERKVSVNFTGVAQGELIGSLTIQSRKNTAEQVDLPTVIHDVKSYMKGVRGLKGYNITLLTIPSTISYMTGVDTRSSGIAASPFISGFVNGVEGFLAGVVPSVAKSGGVTVPTAEIGCTFLVLVDSEQSRLVDIRMNYTPSNTPQGPKPEASNNSGNNSMGIVGKDVNAEHGNS